ncbi:MAG: hypothetical protein WA902_14955 [Thermosynechococcaceae cyanobacterium]
MSAESLSHRLEQELADLGEVVAEVKRVLGKYQQSQDADLLPAIAMNLQSYYTRVERVMVSVALDCEQTVPEGKEWHRQLLEQMGKDIEDVRPALISESLLASLDELRRLRHVVRSIYAFKLDPDLLLPIAQRLPNGHGQFQKDCAFFLKKLTQRRERE